MTAVMEEVELGDVELHILKHLFTRWPNTKIFLFGDYSISSWGDRGVYCKFSREQMQLALHHLRRSGYVSRVETNYAWEYSLTFFGLLCAELIDLSSIERLLQD